MSLLLTVLLLGILQGLTEFLPISSSGHLVVAQALLGLAGPRLPLDVALHLGTLLATGVVYRGDLARMFRSLFAPPEGGSGVQGPRRLLLLLLVGTLPTGVIGLVLKDRVEALFDAPVAAGAFLFLTGILLYGTRRIRPGGRGLEGMGFLDALVIGAVQGMAVLPGLSRSGSTIAAGLFLGLDRPLAARYSFLLSIPAVLGAALLEAPEALSQSHIPLLYLGIGLAISAAVGYLALLLLLRLVEHGALHRFAYYCWGLGGLILLVWAGFLP